MRARLMVMLLFFAGLFAVAYGLRLAMVPDMLPVGEVETAGWRFQLAFILKATENIGSIGAAIVILVGALSWLRRRMART